MNHLIPPLLTVPLGGQAHALARQFAAMQATPQKGKQVYLNTLAVYAVHSYLRWLQIESNLSQSDSWHPGMQAVFDVADLVIPEVGHLECRPVLPEQAACFIPPEVTENRIGYVGLQFSERLEEVQLIGFAPSVDTDLQPEQLKIADFQSLDLLIERIYQLKYASQNRVNLSQWVQNIFETGWQTVEDILGTEKIHLALNFRNSAPLETGVRRGKLIDLGIQLAGHPLALVVALAPLSQEEMDILVQLHPTENEIYLPPTLQLLVKDETETVILEAQSRSADNYIQLQFSGSPGESFSLTVTLDEGSVTQNFVI